MNKHEIITTGLAGGYDYVGLSTSAWPSPTRLYLTSIKDTTVAASAAPTWWDAPAISPVQDVTTLL